MAIRSVRSDNSGDDGDIVFAARAEGFGHKAFTKGFGLRLHRQPLYFGFGHQIAQPVGAQDVSSPDR